MTSFQKEIHAIKIDDGVVDIERVHAEDARELEERALRRLSERAELIALREAA